LVVVGLEQSAYLGSYPIAWFASLVLLALTAIPAGFIIYRLDQFEPEPASLVAIALVWGGVVALTFSALANSALLSFLQNVFPGGVVDSWGAALVAPLNEELYKGAGLVALYLMRPREFDSLMDGLVYGAMIGLGFQVVENVQYFMMAAAQSAGGQLAAVAGMFLVRVVLAGVYSHMLFTGLMGFGFAYFVINRGRVSVRLRVATVALFACLAWAAHFVWNSPVLDAWLARGGSFYVLALIVKGMPFLALLGLVGYLARRREAKAFARLMAAEVGSDVVTVEEFRVLRSGRLRRRALRRMKKVQGKRASKVLKRLQRAQMDLAVLHAKTGSPNAPILEARRDEVRRLKALLAQAH